MDHPPYTSSEFHNDVQKQLVNAAIAALSDTKLEWAAVAPFLTAARALCRDDMRLNGRLAMHGMEYEGAELVPAEEAFLSVSVRDRDDGIEWLSQTYWLSDIALADEDPERVRGAVAAMERTIVKLQDWLAIREEERAREEDSARDDDSAGEAAEASPAP